MPKRILHSLAQGGAVSPVWPAYVSLGGILFGFFSIPSDGGAIVLIPMFLTAGAVIGCGMVAHFVNKQVQCGRYIVQMGLALMILASMARTFSLWGVSQNGAGSNILASLVWGWITVGCALLFICSWIRGLG
jgi:hypothetical protein